jgi:hypothetical protein
VVDRAAQGQVFCEYFGFLCHSFIHSFIHSFMHSFMHLFIPLIPAQLSPSIIQGWYNRPINGLSTDGIGSAAAPWIKQEENSRLGQPQVKNDAERLSKT